MAKIKTAPPAAPATDAKPANALDLIAGLAKRAPAKKGARPAKPEITEPGLDAAIDQWIAADKEVDKWEGVKTTAEAQILAFARPARLDVCRGMGKVESTVRLNNKVVMTAKCQYSKVAAEHMDALREAFPERFDTYFKLRTRLELLPSATEDPAILQALVDALGPDRFAAVFAVTQYGEVTETFHSDYTLKADVQAAAEPFIESEVVKPYKPSLRVA